MAMWLRSERRIPVVPQGGLTGLVGAAVAAPTGEELVISLERLDAVRMVDPIDFAMIAEAGCILENAKKAAEGAGTACSRSPSARRALAASAATSPPTPAGSTCCATA